jgi:hypothetical protein
MIPVEQTCPKCHIRFLGSDVVGLPCPSCMGMSGQSITEALAAMNQMFYEEEESK